MSSAKPWFVIYCNSLPYEKRREMHDSLAVHLSQPRRVQLRILAALGGSSEPSVAVETIAYHYEQAQQWLLAAQNHLAAAERSWENEQYSRASANYRQALENLEKLPAQEVGPEVAALRGRIYAGQGDLAVVTGEYLSAVTAYESALACMPESLDPDERSSQGLETGNLEGRLRRKLALVLPTQGKVEDGIRRLSEFIRRPNDTDDLAAVATMAWLYWQAGMKDAGK
jgi:tetratricopeptide (TPR) repeat protein